MNDENDTRPSLKRKAELEEEMRIIHDLFLNCTTEKGLLALESKLTKLKDEYDLYYDDEPKSNNHVPERK